MLTMVSSEILFTEGSFSRSDQIDCSIKSLSLGLSDIFPKSKVCVKMLLVFLTKT